MKAFETVNLVPEIPFILTPPDETPLSPEDTVFPAAR